MLPRSYYYVALFVLYAAIAALNVVSPHAQTPTPRETTVTNATVTKKWTLAGYEVVVADPANPTNGGAILVKFTVATKLGDDTLTMENHVAAISGAAALLAFQIDLESRVAKLVVARDTAPVYNGTRAALYAWLQANGYIDKAAQ